jgi:hypothetical protein
MGNQTRAYTLGAGATWERQPALDGLGQEQAAVLSGYACFPPEAKPSAGGAEPPDPDENSARYDPGSRPKIGDTTILKARSFAPGPDASEFARLAFSVDSTSLVYTIGKTLHPTSGYRDGILQEIYSDGSKAPTKVVWYALTVTDRDWYTLSIRDKDDDGTMYSDRVHVTLFEGSVLSLLLDSADVVIYKRQDDLIVCLAPGTYLLRIGSVSDAKGGNFGLLFSRNY